MPRPKKEETTTAGCPFCINQRAVIDYKDVATLRKYTSSFARILPRRKTNICTTHQRKLDTAIKRARIMGLMPFVKE